MEYILAVVRIIGRVFTSFNTIANTLEGVIDLIDTAEEAVIDLIDVYIPSSLPREADPQFCLRVQGVELWVSMNTVRDAHVFMSGRRAMSGIQAWILGETGEILAAGALWWLSSEAFSVVLDREWPSCRVSEGGLKYKSPEFEAAVEAASAAAREASDTIEAYADRVDRCEVLSDEHFDPINKVAVA
jgi:hypothetical protein